jgi:hypothetical protein
MDAGQSEIQLWSVWIAIMAVVSSYFGWSGRVLQGVCHINTFI